MHKSKIKPKLKINLPIEFRKLRKNLGYYSDKPLTKIEVAVGKDLFLTIETLYHEFTHFVFDYLQTFAQSEARGSSKFVVGNQPKSVYLKTNKNREEKLCRKLDKQVAKLFKQYFKIDK